MTADPAALFGVPVDFEHDGVTYKSRRLDLLGIAKFCTWLEQRAVDAARRLTESWPPEARREYLDGLHEDITAGAYRVGGSGYLKALRQPECGAYLLFLSLEKDHPDLTPAGCQEMFLAKLEERARDALEAHGRPNSSGARKGSSGPSKKSSPSSRKKASRRKSRRG